jgi:hypothetical protein
MTLQLDPRISASCSYCNFSSNDPHLLNKHDCEVQLNGGNCEDYPACGHERGDCNGLLYGSDEYIKEQTLEAIRTGHGDCNHAEGQFFCEYQGDEEEYDDEGDPED